MGGGVLHGILYNSNLQCIAESSLISEYIVEEHCCESAVTSGVSSGSKNRESAEKRRVFSVCGQQMMRDALMLEMPYICILNQHFADQYQCY